MEGFVKAAKVSDMSHPGAMTFFEEGEDEVLLVNMGGKIYAMGNVCPHEECYLYEDGTVDGEEIECTCHGTRFSMATGEVTEGPSADNLPVYAVKIEGDDILVGPA